MYNKCMFKWYLFRLLCCRRNDSGEICNNKVLNAVAHFVITWCHSQSKTLTTRLGPPAGRMSVWLLWQIVLKNVVEPLPVEQNPEIFSVMDELVLYNRLIQSILSVSSKNSSRTKPTSSEFVFLQLKPVELNIFQEFTSITKRSPLRWAWFWKTRAESSRKRHKDHL